MIEIHDFYDQSKKTVDPNNRVDDSLFYQGGCSKTSSIIRLEVFTSRDKGYKAALHSHHQL